MDSKKDVKAVLYGEKSAGATFVAIFEDDQLVWLHRYFQSGATYESYIDGMVQVVDDMVNCVDWRDYEGNDLDDQDDQVDEEFIVDESVLFDLTEIVQYVPGFGWEASGDRAGQSDEVLEALMYLGVVPQDGEYEEPDVEGLRSKSAETVLAVAAHIKELGLGW